MRFIPLILILCLLTGCILPIPHTTWRSQEIGGKILDERTHDPIQGAKVFLTDHPNVSCESDSNGCYRLKETYNRHLLYLAGPGNTADWPEGQVWWPHITVSQTNYVPRDVDWGELHPDVILLKRLGEPPTPRPWLIFNGSGEILKDMGAGQYVKPGDIRITEHSDDGIGINPPPSRIHIGFVQRVYDPQVTPVNNFDQVSFGPLKRSGLDWEFGVVQELGYSRAHNIQDSLRQYRLEFIP